LSGGQQQRVALGRAIVRDPAVFLFDEPLSNLDAKLRGAMRGELIKLHRRLNVTIIYVTHDQVEAMTMGESVVIMRDGVIQQQGAPLDIYQNPDNLFVAEFLGNPPMNVFQGNLETESGVVRAVGSEFMIELDRRVSNNLASTGSMRCVFGIRPEHLIIETAKPPHDHLQSVEGTVELVEMLGADCVVEVNASGTSLVSKVDADLAPKLGSRIHLFLDPKRVYLFDGESEVRLRTA
ncbi:MAG: TOBE domain-containing protein, partial [Alphaproteobacteria bacterium]